MTHMNFRRAPFCRTRTGPVEADGAVDAQNAPTAPWKTLCVFHELPQGLSHQVTHEKLRKAPKYRWETRIDPKMQYWMSESAALSPRGLLGRVHPKIGMGRFFLRPCHRAPDLTTKGLARRLACSENRPRKLEFLAGGAVEIHSFLRVEPELRGRSKRGSQLQRHLGTHRSATIDDPVDHLDVATEMISQSLLGHAQRDQELLAQNLSRARRCPSPPRYIHRVPPQWSSQMSTSAGPVFVQRKTTRH